MELLPTEARCPKLKYLFFYGQSDCWETMEAKETEVSSVPLRRRELGMAAD